ncbi:uncharacterized protein LOC132611961 [Lycium barbarum]|uniref:uncharacterized protein LOC132611961 n=1 Tax=Lycium barbarum TaxID=112863 RepID=UPI00293F1362|nr:uncharacterized protein LOC132611961 [Lycium barbarum]
MAKDYDRLSWRFLVQVLRKMGFAEEYVDMVWRLIANNWYSILINRQSFGFFHSTRGVKQGDPLSPALFILVVEVLSMALNSLFEKDSFRGYGMPKWSAKLNNLSYADNTIIFASADKASLEMIMSILHDYERESGQKINADKSFFICIRRRQKLFYKDMMKKVKDRLQAWRVPPKCVINDLHKLFNRFFWQTKEEGRSKHWSAWENVYYPKNEGGLGFGSLHDISKALFAKFWWRFKTSSTLWSNFMWNKYCTMFRPTVVQWKGGSQTWKMMLQARDEMEHGVLHDLIPIRYQNEVLGDELEELMSKNQWNYAKLQEVLPADIVDYVRMELGHFVRKNKIDKPWWMFTSSASVLGPFLLTKHTVLCWWNSQTAMKPLYQPIPALVLWQIWKSRNTRRHGGVVSQNKVKWTFSDTGCFKCNTDGASKGNPGPSSAAFCIRDSSEEFIYAKVRILTETTNLVAEAVAIEEGIKYCVLHELLHVIVETDSLTMQKVLDVIWEVPWNIALPVRSTIQYNQFQDIPTHGRRLINMDKSQLPNFKVRSTTKQASYDNQDNNNSSEHQ